MTDAGLEILTGQIATVSQEEPMVRLRWNGGRLQQTWRVTTYPPGTMNGLTRFEWRDVPSESDP